MKQYSLLIKHSVEKRPFLTNGMQITSGDKSNPLLLQAFAELATSMTSQSQPEDDIALPSTT